MCLWGVFFLLFDFELLLNVDERVLRPILEWFCIIVGFFPLKIWQFLIPGFKNTMWLKLSEYWMLSCDDTFRQLSWGKKMLQKTRQKCFSMNFAKQDNSVFSALWAKIRMESYWREEKTEVQRWCSGSVGSKCTLTFTSVALIYRQGGG